MLERFGLRFVASPRHADVLMVTGPVTRNMRGALLRAHNATPDPKWVVAVGGCAADRGIFKGSYACLGGVSDAVPVDLHIPRLSAVADRAFGGTAGVVGACRGEAPLTLAERQTRPLRHKHPQRDGASS